MGLYHCYLIKCHVTLRREGCTVQLGDRWRDQPQKRAGRRSVCLKEHQLGNWTDEGLKFGSVLSVTWSLVTLLFSPAKWHQFDRHSSRWRVMKWDVEFLPRALLQGWHGSSWLARGLWLMVRVLSWFGRLSWHTTGISASHSSFTGLFFLIRFPVSYSRFGNAKKMLTSLNQEDFVNPLGACGLVDKGGWWVGPSSISFLEFVVIRPWKIMYERNW